MAKNLRMFSNMLGRERDHLPRDNACYDCGFPCRPFSLLNTSESQSLFAADDAEIFRETMRTVYSNKPLLCVLENVLGLLRVFNVVQKYLDNLTEFRWCYVVIDPRRLGDSLSRRRVYIILVHKPPELFDYFYVCFVVVILLWLLAWYVFSLDGFGFSRKVRAQRLHHQ